MNHHLPIEQLVRRWDTRFQLGFAQDAKRRIRPSARVAYSASPDGLHVLAAGEEALVEPIAELIDVYGPRLEIVPPAVRLIRGVQVKEPIGEVRISVAKAYRDAVASALLARGAKAMSEHAGFRHAVLRYEAPMASLLGLPVELARLTGGTAKHWTALSHYALVTGDPGPRAA